MTEEERLNALDHLLNPKMPDPFISWDYGVLCRDLPPRRTLRERMRALVRRSPQKRSSDRPSAEG